jgi:UDP-4-amino-4,6-dideoxy-N-acetyl-beta-L-altrosamine transaminase
VSKALARKVEAFRPNAFLPYGRQLIEEDDIAAVCEALRGDLLTTGPYVGRFEQALSHAVDASRSVVCANGTAALHMAARALGLGQGKTIIVPSITFLATASAPHMNGADVVFADVDPENGLMRPRDLEDAIARAGKADALFNVHLNGQCGDIEAIAEIARANGLKIVEDACHTLGASYIARNDHVSQIGSNRFSDLTVFSFHPVKTVAMGEGGAVTTNDAALGERLVRARSHGMIRDPQSFARVDAAFDENGAANPWYYELDEPEFNWRANDIQCALGLSQLSKLGRFVSHRRATAAVYDEVFAGQAPLLKPIARTRDCLPAWHLYVVQIDFASAGISRASLMHALAGEGIGTQVHYVPVHSQPYYSRRYPTPALPGAEHYYARSLSLPLSAAMSDDDAYRVAETVIRLLKR